MCFDVGLVCDGFFELVCFVGFMYFEEEEFEEDVEVVEVVEGYCDVDVGYGNL